MSNEALTWALRDAQGVPSHAVAVLIGLANHADENGRGAYPSQKLLGKYARKTERQVRKDLQNLEELGIIRRGDQRLAAHIPADRRPIVWDLVMDSGAPKTGGTTVPAGTTRPVVEFRGEPDDRSSSTERGEPQFLQTIREPSTPRVTTTGGRDARRGAPTDRGTRIPDHFALTESMRKWGREKYPALDGEAETAAFVDYWKSVPGAKGRKLDWTAAWRTWIRRTAERHPRTAPGHASPTPPPRPSAATVRTQAGLDLIAQFAAEEGVDALALMPHAARKEITP